MVKLKTTFRTADRPTTVVAFSGNFGTRYGTVHGPFSPTARYKIIIS